MKVVAYGIRPSEKGILAQANHKKHDITLISNPLTEETAFYAQGKEAVIVFAHGGVPGAILGILAEKGIRHLVNLSGGNCLAEKAASRYGIEWATIHYAEPLQPMSTEKTMHQAAEQTILLLDQWQLLA